MARVSRVLPHLSEVQIKEKIRSASSFRRQQKWLIVYNDLVEARPVAEIAKHTGISVRTVHQVISDYNRQGAAAIETPSSGGRQRNYLSVDEDKGLLALVTPKAKRGEITTKAEVEQAIEHACETQGA